MLEGVPAREKLRIVEAVELGADELGTVRRRGLPEREMGSPSSHIVESRKPGLGGGDVMNEDPRNVDDAVDLGRGRKYCELFRITFDKRSLLVWQVELSSMDWFCSFSRSSTHCETGNRCNFDDARIKARVW